MDEIQERLKETSNLCIQSYEVWRKNISDDSVREELQTNIHELRKVASRLEIEIAISERDQMKSKRIPIPPHRSSKKGSKDSDNDSMGNGMEADGNDMPDRNNHSNGPDIERKMPRRSRKPKND